MKNSFTYTHIWGFKEGEARSPYNVALYKISIEDDIREAKTILKNALYVGLKELLDSCEIKEKAISIWKDLKSELWSSLTPKLVWAGGGSIVLLQFPGESLMETQEKNSILKPTGLYSLNPSC